MTNYGSLKLIIFYSQLIIDVHQKHHRDKEDFFKNTEYQYAISMLLIQIGELANRLTKDFKEYFPNIPWEYMKSFRNRLAHQYGEIDVELTFQISTLDITRIHAQLVKIISDFEEEFPNVINMQEKNY